jgi:hypothetical protein
MKTLSTRIYVQMKYEFYVCIIFDIFFKYVFKNRSTNLDGKELHCNAVPFHPGSRTDDLEVKQVPFAIFIHSDTNGPRNM